MKAEQYAITLNGEFLEHRRAWNASIRAIERIARDLARKNGVLFHLVDDESIRDETAFGYAHGVRIWSGGGLELKFAISKVK